MTKQEVQTLLESVAKSRSEWPSKDGSLDMSKLYKLPEVESLIKTFKANKITPKWLSRNGFIVAEMLLASALK